MEGYIRLYRKITETSFWSNHNATRLALYLLTEANFKDKKTSVKYQEIIVNRGQILTGLKTLKKETGLSIRKIRTSLNFLETIDFLTRKTTNQFSVITITKYNDYQSIPIKATSNSTSKRQASDKQATSTEECKECKEVKHIPKKSKPDFSDDCIEFKILKLLDSKIRLAWPKVKNNITQSGARIISLILKYDNKSVNDIIGVLRWWNPKGAKYDIVIQSPTTFRKKLDQLMAAQLRGNTRTEDEQVEYDRWNKDYIIRPDGKTS